MTDNKFKYSESREKTGTRSRFSEAYPILFKYRLDKRTRNITLAVLAGVIAVCGGLWLFNIGDYLPAWFFSIALAIIALSVLSIPRSIRITESAVEIRCVVEITHIPYEHLKNVRRINRTELKPFVPIFASGGFFGYFGYYLLLRNWEIIKVYTTSWHGLVSIEDIYEQRYLVSSDRPDELVERIERACKSMRDGK